MKHFTNTFFLLSLMVLLGTTSASAQTKVTFRIDMRPQIKDSTFTPGESSIKLSGNQLPFSSIRTIKLKDKAPVDSVYQTTIHFPSPTNGSILKYRYLIRADNKKISERRFRLLQLKGQTKILPVTSFNSFMQ